MATVTLRLAPRRAHVRTARLVASAMARRCGVAEELLDDVRLAVGEACARAVRLHERDAVDVPVTLELTDGDTFSVVVADTSLSDAVDETAAATLVGAAATAVHARSAESPPPPPAPPPTSTPTYQKAAGSPDAGTGAADPGPDSTDGRWQQPERLGLAILEGVVDDLRVERGEEGTRVHMSWPVSFAD